MNKPLSCCRTAVTPPPLGHQSSRPWEQQHDTSRPHTASTCWRGTTGTAGTRCRGTTVTTVQQVQYCRYFSYSLARYYRCSRYSRYSLAVRRLRSVERQLRHSDARQLTLEDSNAELRRQLTDTELTSDQLMTSVHQLTSELDDALQKLQVTRTTGMIDLRIDRESGFYEFKNF